MQALGLSFTVSTCALAIGLALHGAFHMQHLTLSALAIVPALAGMGAGQVIRRKVSPATFRRAFLIALLLLGLEMLARSLFQGATCVTTPARLEQNRKPVGSLRGEADQIIAAMDELLTRA